MAPSTIGFGKRELRGAAGDVPLVKVRREGTGRRPHEEVYPNLVPALLALVDPETRGDPESSLRWTSKSTHTLSAEMLDAHGIRVGGKTIARLLRENGYSLQAPSKTVEGAGGHVEGWPGRGGRRRTARQAAMPRPHALRIGVQAAHCA